MTFRGEFAARRGIEDGSAARVFGRAAWRAISATSPRLFCIALLFAGLGLAAPAQAQQASCIWALLLEDGGTTPSGGSVTWSVGDDIYVTLYAGSGVPSITNISSSAPGVVSVTPSGGGANAEALASGTATLTATTNSAACPIYTLNVTVEVTEAPTAGDTTTRVEASSTDNTVNLDITGYEITAVTVASPPAHGTATASGATLSYTPDAGYAGPDSFTYTATNAAGSSAPATASIIVNVPTIILSPASMPDGVAGTAYSQTLGASGGTAPYSFAITAGGLPAGLSLASDGTLAGRPAEAGNFSVTVTATGNNGFTGSSDYTLAIDGPTITLVPPAGALPGATGGSAYSQNISASGGAAPYNFAVTAGNLPDGLSLSADGTLAGMPTEAGSFTFTVTATDNNSFTGSSDYTLAVDAPAITLTPSGGALPGATGGSAYSQSISASGGTAPYSFAVTAGDLPDGLSLATDGTLSGSPTEAGSFTFTVTATDSNGFAGNSDYTLAVDGPTIMLGPAALPDGEATVDYGPVTLAASGGTAPYTFAVTGGSLPTGLSLATDGTLSGTTTEAGSFTITITVTDNNGFAGTRQYTLAIDAPEITLTPASLPSGRVNDAYSADFEADGGTAPYSFTATAGNLPDGLSLATDGTLSGTPTKDGSFVFSVTATDNNGFTGTRDYTLAIDGLILPEAQAHTLSVLAGTNGTLDLTQGATGGPFTGAAIVTPAASEAGTARIEQDNGNYRLHFAAAGTFTGTTSLSYTLSNADGTSAPATITIKVLARPDPSQDPEVIGLIRAQTESAKRFARTQISNFNRRLEQLHDGGTRRRNAMNIDIGVEVASSEPNVYVDNEALSERRAADTLGWTTRDFGDAAEPAVTRGNYASGDLAVWTGGYINFGTSDDGGIDLDHTTVGISGGMDYRFTQQFIAGLGMGYSRDETDVGDNGTESKAHALSFAAYGSYQPAPAVFIDGLIGYSFMDFDSRRFVTATGDIATGQRDGHQIFGSVTVGYEHHRDRLLVSPYGRLQASRSTLDDFTETDGGIWNLRYGEQTIDTLSGTLGLRAEYAVPTGWGVLTPRTRLEYTHDFEGSSRATLGYADIGGLPYALDVESFSRDHVAVGLGIGAAIGENWNLGFDYRAAFGTDGDSQEHSFTLKLGTRF